MIVQDLDGALTFIPICVDSSCKGLENTYLSIWCDVGLISNMATHTGGSGYSLCRPSGLLLVTVRVISLVEEGATSVEHTRPSGEEGREREGEGEKEGGREGGRVGEREREREREITLKHFFDKIPFEK